jgi:hypothetical protein
MLLVGIGSDQAGIDQPLRDATKTALRNRSQSRKRPCLFFEKVE